jgi:DNA-directed RNA polymerase specialized sigma24 family protein
MADTDVYATAADFEQIFTDDMSGLYLLSFLLAGDPDTAETVFAAAIEESSQGKRVFKEWARSWARRSIIQSAIRTIGPQQNSENGARTPALARAIEKLPLALQAEASAIVELAPVERFVFVMSVLEKYSDHDCAILLSCSRRDVPTARVGALQQLGRVLNLHENDAEGLPHSAVQLPRSIIELTIARYFPMQTLNGSRSLDAGFWR